MTYIATDVFENFRKTCMQCYKLDLCHYFTSPDLSWDAMLKMTNIKLELMTDIDMFQFIEKGMHGGVDCQKIQNLNWFVSKLIPTLRDKKEYVLHYRNLQLYLDLGLKIKKIHRVLKFDQTPWLKQYIDFNTEK